MGNVLNELEGTGVMTKASSTDQIQKITTAFGQLRAEYENENELSQKFAPPTYFNKLTTITPTFLIGGRGTGKTTTLRSMSFLGQSAMHQSHNAHGWAVVGAYWKVEPNVVSAFRSRGIGEDQWTRIFSHYLNLRLSALVVDMASWLQKKGVAVSIDPHQVRLFQSSLHLGEMKGLSDISEAIDVSMVEIEAKLNGSISALATSEYSLLGKPLEYLFRAVHGTGVDRQHPFMFCIDEYENLAPYQQRVLNTLIKQVGGSPYTFKIGVRNAVAIDSSTLIENQPLQDPADFTKVDIVRELKDQSFEEFAATVVGQRLKLVDPESLEPRSLLPSISLEDEAVLLGANALKDELSRAIEMDRSSTEMDSHFVNQLSPLESVLALHWAHAHSERPIDTIRWAQKNPNKWKRRVVNYGYAALFTIRQNRVGRRKYYAGWRTFCQVADGNIRYMIRLVSEAIQLHTFGGGTLAHAVSIDHQTIAAMRVGERTVRDLQGWSRQGADITRLCLGLGSVFSNLAREAAFGTPEVNQFRVHYQKGASSIVVDGLLAEAVGQGVLIAFEGDKNARRSGATAEMDYQLHPVLSAFFVYSPRKKRRMVLDERDLIELTRRESAPMAIRRILSSRGLEAGSLCEQLTLFPGEQNV